MSRVTAPVTKLARAVNPAVKNFNHGAVLMPKYAELLKRNTLSEADSSRGITTAHRPTPQPKPSKSYNRPLMQTFSSVASYGPPPTSIDATLFPFPVAAFAAQDQQNRDALAGLRMPLLPDSYVRHAPVAETPTAHASRISVVSGAPGTVVAASALTAVEGMGAVDGVAFGFVHQPEPKAADLTGLSRLI